jgi:serine/threonine-protein kinase RsbW
VREAAINAIRHGNHEAPGTQVHVVLEAHPDGIRAWVRDEGEGFDPKDAPDPTTEDHILMTSGRGLLMIRSFVDDVEFHYESGRGMTVALSKKLKRGEVPPAVDDGADGPGKEIEP